MKKILIIRAGALGDMIVTLPVLSALKKQYDGLSIDMMGYSNRLEILKYCGYVKNIFSIDSRSTVPLFMNTTKIDFSSLQYLQLYDSIISYIPDSTGIFEKNIGKISSCSIHIGQSKPNFIDNKNRTHITHVLMKGLSPFGIAPVAEPPKLNVSCLPNPDRTEILDSDKKLIAIHPGSGGIKKCWPAKSYIKLIEALVEKHYIPVVIFGPADENVKGQILPCIKNKKIQIVENTSLVSLHKILTRCGGMVGNDSGISHLAAALGVPVVALFGPPDPAIWGPRGETVRIIWGDEIITEDIGKTKNTKKINTKKITDVALESILNTMISTKIIC